MTRPATGRSSNVRRSAYGCRTRPSHRIPAPTGAAATPMTRAQPNSATVTWPKCGSPGIASENVPSPVQLSRPMKMSVPMPADSRPGNSVSTSIGPPSPDASISRKAPARGFPSRVLMPAKLPEAASTRVACSGRFRRVSRMASTARPPPIRIDGISGPRTMPKTKVASAARMTPGSCEGVGGPCSLKPPAGDGPPRPGRYWMASAASTAPITSIGSGHQTGVVANPSPCGRCV